MPTRDAYWNTTKEPTVPQRSHCNKFFQRFNGEMCILLIIASQDQQTHG